jgi:hypothetical protein
MVGGVFEIGGESIRAPGTGARVVRRVTAPSPVPGAFVPPNLKCTHRRQVDQCAIESHPRLERDKTDIALDCQFDLSAILFITI